MFKNNLFQKLTVSVVLLGTVLATTPVTAAELTVPKVVLGSVSSVGSVQLRGVSISREGTLFAGDQIAVGSGSGAKVTMANGQKILLDQLTNLTFAQDGQLNVAKGNVAFSGKAASLDIIAGDYEITGDRALAGNIAYVGTGYVGLRINSGNAVVRNLKTKQTYKVGAGEERMFSMSTGGSSTPIAQLASTVPTALPSVPQMPPAPQSQGNSRMRKAGWIAIAASVGGAAVAIALLSTRNDSNDNSAVLARQRALQNAQSVTSAAATTTVTANQVAATANTTASVAGLPPAAQAQALSLQSAATATAQQVATLTSQLNALQAQLQNATDAGAIAQVAAQVETVRQNLNGQIASLNSTISSLNLLLQQNATVPGVPSTAIPLVPTAPPPASSSIPA